ncbi:hypothetical protein HHK36_013028 [Tetracentron sinense]|uniref:Uncharacterized protein n=1 Tax=Tetracentron sinense TaxID=13715 RepID=A0A835DG81_TETSI|nr:hypothetical protein HHK36_013028 [Tetracentron sinense]
MKVVAFSVAKGWNPLNHGLLGEALQWYKWGGCRYDCKLFTEHGVDVLEDLVITLADGIMNVYLELISVDSNVTSEMNSLGLMCSLSTRSLQRLRNEVALNQWLHQNMESVVSMYEDRFDLFTLQIQFLEEPNKGQTKKLHWWKKITLRKPASMLSPLCYVVISQLSMPVKRTKELRALIGSSFLSHISSARASMHTAYHIHAIEHQLDMPHHLIT